jgi:hypothetical protein
LKTNNIRPLPYGWGFLFENFVYNWFININIMASTSLVDNITRRVNGGGPSLTERFLSLLETVEPTQTITTTSSGTGTITTNNLVNNIIGAPTTLTTTGTNTTPIVYPLTTSNLLYSPNNFSFHGKYINIENINIDVLRKFMVKEISFVKDLIEIDDSELNCATLILSVDYDIYKELEVEYILEKVDDYVKEKISGLIHCMDSDLDMKRLHMRFVPKSTLLDIINNDKED